MWQTWNTPEVTYSRLYDDMLHQHHVLIAGATGSGKSVVINGIIHAALKDSPARVGFVLIDPKRVELAPYANLPHTITHAKGFDPKAWLNALTQAVNIMDARYVEMERKRQKMYNGSDIYVIIDEWANVYKNGGAACYKAVMRLTSEGRAARVHCIIATQVPKACIIPTEVRENMSARLCLRCNTKAESRVLMDVAGCETLPQYGYGYYITPCGKDLYPLPMTPETKLQKVIDHWTHARPRRHLFKRRAG